MQYIRKLPLLLSFFMSIIISIISYKNGVAQEVIYIRILVSLILFYLLGLIIRKNIENIYDIVCNNRKILSEITRNIDNNKIN